MSDGQAAMKLLLDGGLLDGGLLHGDCLTVNGRTVAENLADVSVFLSGNCRFGPMRAAEGPWRHVQSG